MARTVDIDQVVAELREGEQAWAALPLPGRRALLAQVRDLIVEHAAEWVRVAGGIKRLDPASPLVGEEWISGPYAVVSSVDALAETLAALEQGRSPVDGFRSRGARRPVGGARPAAHRLGPAAAQRLFSARSG